MTSYAHQNETSPSLGAAICETVATFVGFWEGQRNDVLRRPLRDLAVLRGGCDLRKCRHFRGLLGGPAEWCPTQTTTIARRPLGGAAICETVATFVGSWEVQRRGVLRGSQL